MGIGQVMIFVNSLERSMRFYCDLIGLEVAQDMSKESGMIIMKNDGCFLTLHENFKPIEHRQGDCKTVPIFKVSDIETAKEKLLNAGVELIGEITDSPVHRYQALKDPDGIWIEIAQFK